MTDQPDQPTDAPEPAEGPQPATEGLDGSEPAKAGRKPDGRFAKGNRVNPRGKPKGTRNKLTQMSEGLIGQFADRIIQRAIQLAVVNGDSTALKLMVDRIHPIPRDRKIHFGLVKKESGALDIDLSIAAISDGLANGDITPSEASEVGKLITMSSQLQQFADLEARLAALEAAKPKEPTDGD